MFRKYFILSLLTTILSLWTVATSLEAAGCGRAKLFSGKVLSGQARERAKNTLGKLLPRNWERNK